MLSFR